jgi:phosphate-selective porin OprO and OprP
VAGGVHFQDVGGWEEVQNRKDNNADFGVDEGFSLTGKIVLMPWVNDVTKGVHVGIASSVRTPKTEDLIDAVRFDVRGPANVNRRKYVDTDRIRNTDRTLHAGYELGAYYGGFKIISELNTVSLTRDNDSIPTAKFGGHYIAASRLLFGGRQQYNTRDGEFTQPALGRGWGDVEVAARYEYIDLNSPNAGITGGEAEAWTVGINFLPNNNVKFMLNYSLVNNDRFANGRGRLNVGTTEAGVPTSNPQLIVQKSGKAGEDYKVLALRVQVSF